MYKHLFSKRLSNKLYKQWNIAIDSFTEYYSDLKTIKLLIDLKGIHGFPMICGKYLYKVEILNESQNIFNRKERVEYYAKENYLMFAIRLKSYQKFCLL